MLASRKCIFIYYLLLLLFLAGSPLTIVRICTLHFLHTAGGGAVKGAVGRVEIFRKENTTRSLTEEPEAVFHNYMATCQVSLIICGTY